MLHLRLHNARNFKKLLLYMKKIINVYLIIDTLPSGIMH